MATDNIKLNWQLFSGKSEDFPTRSTRFLAFMQNKSLHKTLIGKVDIFTRPNNLSENLSNEQRAAGDAQQKEYTIKVEEKETCNNNV